LDSEKTNREVQFHIEGAANAEMRNEPSERSSCPRLTLIVPCHNEEQVLPETFSRLGRLFDELTQAGLILQPAVYFVDDGSTDGTWGLIERLSTADFRCKGLKLSRNFGQQNALLAGLLSVSGDVLISLDADLQDDVAAIKDMVLAYARGAEVVYGVRRSRKTDSLFKRSTAESFYRLLQVMGVQLIFNHADFRLLSRRVVEELRNCGERNLLLRGLIPQLGFPSALIYYDRDERFAGQTKYSVSKMVSLAVSGITSFTEVPLRIITLVGMTVSLISFAMAAWALVIRFFNPAAVPGWASIVIPLYMLGGVQLICLGVIGQYLAKIYTETKARPRFIVERII